MAQWKLINGAWILLTPNTTNQKEPTTRGIDSYQAPNCLIKHGEWRKDAKIRRFDKPSDSQIKSLIKEDDEALKASQDITPIVHESKKDLESGKLRIHSSVLNSHNKKIVPFKHITDERGITHVLPRLDEEKVQVDIRPPGEGNLSTVSQASVIEQALYKIKMEGREAFNRRTIS